MEGRARARKHKLTGKMSAPHVRAFCAGALLCVLLARVNSGAADSGAAAAHAAPARDQQDDLQKKIELFDGVSVKFPHDANSTEKLMSFEIDTERSLESGRGTKGGGKQKKLMQRILPMFILPFLIQSTIVPFFLSMLKFMLFKSLMVGKVALALILLNAFKNQNTNKGRDSNIADVHYGYSDHGMEYGALFH